MAHVTRTCKNPACKKEYQSRTSRSLYCSPKCNTEYHRRNKNKTVIIGLLSVEFRDVEDKTLEELTAIVEGCLTDDMRKIIHTPPAHTGDTTHDAI
ncbi:hypothetical protein PsexTeo8_21100 [Pseudomonas extremaustralis]|nr:hypothetical protein [Pseudomonas extremaustralis]